MAYAHGLLRNEWLDMRPIKGMASLITCLVLRRNSRPTSGGSGVLFLVSMASFLLKHPLANVRGAIHHLNALSSALIQQANSVDIDDGDFI